MKINRRFIFLEKSLSVLALFTLMKHVLCYDDHGGKPCHYWIVDNGHEREGQQLTLEESDQYLLLTIALPFV